MPDHRRHELWMHWPARTLLQARFFALSAKTRRRFRDFLTQCCFYTWIHAIHLSIQNDSIIFYVKIFKRMHAKLRNNKIQYNFTWLQNRFFKILTRDFNKMFFSRMLI